MARIQVIDDDEQVRETLKTLLEAAGHSVSETGNGPFWMAPPRFTSGLILTDADGQWSFPLAYPAGTAGVTVHLQVFQQSVFPNNNITQLLSTTVIP